MTQLVTTQRRLPTHRPPTHPGAMLLEQFLKPLGISQSDFAKRIDVSFPRLNEIINGRRGVTTDTALRLAAATSMEADFWLGLQQDWDLWHAMRSDDAKAIAKIEPISSTRATHIQTRRVKRGRNVTARVQRPTREPSRR